MAIRVRLQDVANPQHLAVLATLGERDLQQESDGSLRVVLGNPESGTDQRLMIVYTGWVGATHGAVADLTRDEVISFVPRGDGRIQTFGEPNRDVDDALAIVSASLSSFGGEPDTAALDDASVNLEIRQFPGIGGQPRVLILRATLAAAGGAVHGFAYQVTVLVHPSQLGEVLRLPRHERA